MYRTMTFELLRFSCENSNHKILTFFASFCPKNLTCLLHVCWDPNKSACHSQAFRRHCCFIIQAVWTVNRELIHNLPFVLGFLGRRTLWYSDFVQKWPHHFHSNYLCLCGVQKFWLLLRPEDLMIRLVSWKVYVYRVIMCSRFTMLSCFRILKI